MNIIELIVGVWWDPGPNNPTFLTVKPLHVSIEYRVVQQQRVVWSEQLWWWPHILTSPAQPSPARSCSLQSGLGSSSPLSPSTARTHPELLHHRHRKWASHDDHKYIRHQIESGHTAAPSIQQLARRAGGNQDQDAAALSSWLRILQSVTKPSLVQQRSWPEQQQQQQQWPRVNKYQWPPTMAGLSVVSPGLITNTSPAYTVTCSHCYCCHPIVIQFQCCSLSVHKVWFVLISLSLLSLLKHTVLVWTISTAQFHHEAACHCTEKEDKGNSKIQSNSRKEAWLILFLFRASLMTLDLSIPRNV